MKKFNNITKFLIVLILSVLFFMCTPAGSGSGGGGGGSSSGGGSDDKTISFQNIWTNLNPSLNPSARYNHTMVYVGNGKIILFGGYSGPEDDETWEYDIILNT